MSKDAIAYVNYSIALNLNKYLIFTYTYVTKKSSRKPTTSVVGMKAH